jgi:hypothetical protein
MLGYVTTPTALLGPGKVFNANPVYISGDEVEGGPATFDRDTSTIVPVVAVQQSPQPGDYVKAQNYRYRWGYLTDGGDPRCNDTTHTIMLSIVSCGGPGPGAWDVTIKRNGVVVNTGLSTVSGISTIYVYPFALAGVYEITASRARFVTQTYTRTVTCGTNVVVGAPAQTQAGYCIIQACPEYPVPTTLVANDGVGDFNITATGPCNATFSGTATGRSATGIATCPGSGAPPADSTVSVDVDFVWFPNLTFSGTNATSTACIGSYRNPLPPFNIISFSKVSPAGGGSAGLWTGTISGSVTCSPFHGTVSFPPDANGYQAAIYPGGLILDVTE